MKKISINILVTALLAVTAVQAQRSTTNTTKIKTLKIEQGNEYQERKVMVNTAKQTADLYNMKENIPNGATSALPLITKTVKIDNDADTAYDEKIVFSYRSNTIGDFILVSQNEELAVAVDKGQNLEIVKEITFLSKNEDSNGYTYVFSDGQGNELEFLVQEHIMNGNFTGESK